MFHYLRLTDFNQTPPLPNWEVRQAIILCNLLQIIEQELSFLLRQEGQMFSLALLLPTL